MIAYNERDKYTACRMIVTIELYEDKQAFQTLVSKDREFVALS